MLHWPLFLFLNLALDIDLGLDIQCSFVLVFLQDTKKAATHINQDRLTTTYFGQRYHNDKQK